MKIKKKRKKSPPNKQINQLDGGKGNKKKQNPKQKKPRTNFTPLTSTEITLGQIQQRMGGLERQLL